MNAVKIGVAVFMPVLVLAGCGRQSGPPRHELSGTVTFDGKPVPAGEIQFARYGAWQPRTGNQCANQGGPIPDARRQGHRGRAARRHHLRIRWKEGVGKPLRGIALPTLPDQN